MSGVMNRHCIPGLTMSIALTGNFGECPRIIKTMHTGFSVHVLHYANALFGADYCKETGRYDLAERFGSSVLNALSK